MGMIAIGTGSLTAGIFGMNLAHGFEDHPTAFYREVQQDLTPHDITEMTHRKRKHVCTVRNRSFPWFCKQFFESSPYLPGQQGSYITTVKLAENILPNLGNDLMAERV